jgi:hypothetical protein
VLRGEMSLIGPRPERPEFVPSLEQAVPRYRERLSVRPGLTGLAQVQLPPDTDLESVRLKLACDLFYVRRLGLWLDLRLLAATGCYLVAGTCRLACRLLAIPQGKAVEDHYRHLVEESVHARAPRALAVEAPPVVPVVPVAPVAPVIPLPELPDAAGGTLQTQVVPCD